MKYLIFSDLHANLFGLEQVLRFRDEANIARVIHLGDVVGYHGYPQECIALFQEHGIQSIRGNHDAMLLGDLPFSTCNSDIAPHTLKVSAGRLADGQRDWLSALPGQMAIGENAIGVHASFRSLYETVNRSEKARSALAALRASGKRIAFFGHTHRAGGFSSDTGIHHITHVPLEDTLMLEEERLYLINPGTAGHPRHGLPSSFIVYDDERQWVKYYPFELTAPQQAQLAAHDREIFGFTGLIIFRRRIMRLAKRALHKIWKLLGGSAPQEY